MILVYSTFTRALASRASATLDGRLGFGEVGTCLFNLGGGGRELGFGGDDGEPAGPLGGHGGLELANVLIQQPGIGGAIRNQALALASSCFWARSRAATSRSMSDSASLTAAAAASRSPSIVLIRASACTICAFDSSTSAAASSSALASRGASMTARTSPLLNARSDVDGLRLQIPGDHRIQVNRLEADHRARLNRRPPHAPLGGPDDLHPRHRFGNHVGRPRGRLASRQEDGRTQSRPPPHTPEKRRNRSRRLDFDNVGSPRLVSGRIRTCNAYRNS